MEKRNNSLKPNPFQSSGVRPFGQSSLSSSFLSKCSKETQSSKKPISLSAFLDRKLGKPSSKSVQEKQSSFSCIGSSKKEERSGKDGIGCDLLLDKAVFRQFNCSAINGSGEFQSDYICDEKDLKKRKNPFGVPSGDTEKPSTSKYLVVLADDPKPKPKKRARNLVDKRSCKPSYNHYENGCGSWDSGKAGIDSEEVGFNEVWEGMGSTTLGGLEWH